VHDVHPAREPRRKASLRREVSDWTGWRRHGLEGSLVTDREEEHMAAPFIYIGTNRMKAGMLEGYKRDFMPELLEVVETNEPRIHAFNVFASEDGTEITGVQVHPDAESMMYHMQVLSERITSAYDEYIEATTAIQLYGPPSNAVLEMIGRLSTPGVSVSVNPEHLGGFTRLRSG
jgi:hypothetical protein